MGTKLVGLIVEDELIKAGSYLEFVPHNQHFQLDHIHYNSIVCRFCTSQRGRACLDLFGHMRVFNSLSRALRLSAVSQVWDVRGYKTQVMNN